MVVLELKKVKEMMIKIQNGTLDLGQKAFYTLRLTYLHLLEKQEEYNEIPILPINLKPPNTIAKSKPIKKDPDYVACVQEILTNELFLFRKQLCAIY